MDFIKWLLPGIGVKRWFLLAILGILIFTQGLLYTLAIIWPHIITVKFGNEHMIIYAILMLILGLIVLLTSIKQLVKAVLKAYLEEDFERQHGKVIDVLIRQNILKYAPKIVAIGGGTGLSNLLSGLREITTNITAVVTVADNGGSSGRLRKMDIPAPGDIRNCILSLATAGDRMYDLFNYRYKAEDNVPEGLEGHSFGNLFIATLTRITGDFPSAVKLAGQILAVKGKVLPVTDCSSVHLQAELENGNIITGECEIGKTTDRINTISLTTDCKVTEEVKNVIRDADLVVIGPGSLYTSIIATLLPKGMIDCLKNTGAEVVYISNIMTQVNESINHSVADHIKAIERHLGENVLDAVVVNTTDINKEVLKLYHEEGADLAKVDKTELDTLNPEMIYADLLEINEEKNARHCPEKLAWALAKYMFDDKRKRVAR